MPVMTYKALADMSLLDILDEDKLGMFLNKVQSTYDSRVTYHNDLHAADVM